MSRNSPWPFSLAGKWPERKAKAVIEALESIADENGLKLSLVDITTHSSAYREYFISVKCKKHDSNIPNDSVCIRCARENLVDTTRR